MRYLLPLVKLIKIMCFIDDLCSLLIMRPVMLANSVAQKGISRAQNNSAETNEGMSQSLCALWILSMAKTLLAKSLKPKTTVLFNDST